MATNHGDLAQMLIEGGLTPQASWVIANAIANAASGTFSRGNDTTDSTPTEALRLITPDTRRYRLTNLDYSPAEPFQDRIASKPGQYQHPESDHPYKDSQPTTTAPPLSNPRVQGGNYVKVDNAVEGGSAISRVDLKLRSEQGRHLRLDPSTKSLDAIAWSASSESPKVLGCEVREGEQGTEIVISLRNLQEIDLLLPNGDSRKALVFPQAAAVGPASLSAGGTRSLTRKAVRWADGTSQDILAWTEGSTTAAPAGPAAVCKAWAVFDGTGSGNTITPAASSNITSIVRPTGQATGLFEVTMTNAMSNANYVVLATSSIANSASNRVIALRQDSTFTVSTTKFTLQAIAQDNQPTNAGLVRVSFAVFEAP